MKKRNIPQKRVTLKGILLLGLVLVAVVVPSGLHAAVFNSAADPNILPMLDGFSTLPQSTLDDNDAKVISINNSATAQEQSDALAAANYPFDRTNLSNTKYLGGIRDAYLAADAAGEVPLVNQLLAQGNYESSDHINLDGPTEWASSDNAKDVYGYQRPVCRLSGSINNYSSMSCPSLSFPSGHSRLAFLEGVSLAVMLPEVAPQIMARSAEIANYRAVLGVHYPLDIIGGRAVATRMVAYRLHDNTWKAKFDAAKVQLRNALEAHCGMTIAACVAATPPTMSDATALSYERTKLTYGFARIGASGQSFQAPDYSYELLAEAFPTKTQAELNAILTSTAIDSGYPLDTTGTAAGSANIGWTRLDLGEALTYVDAAPSDTTAPSVSLTAPTNGQVISGTTTLTATASDNVGVTGVEFRVDGVVVNTDTTAPYAYNWNSTTVSDASHTITARAYDAANNSTTSSSVSVTVDNSVPADTTNPTVSLTSPSNGATISGNATLTATASDNTAVTQVAFFLDGQPLGSDATAPYTYSWNSTTASNGSHSLTAKAYDAANNVGTSTAVSVTVNNQVTPPADPPISFALPGVKADTTATFAVTGVCAQSVSGQAVASVPNELSNDTVLVGARFTLACSGDDGEAAVALALDKAYTTNTLKVFKQAGSQLTDITQQMTIATETVSGATVTVIRYTLQDGGFGDEDGVGNRQLVDPIFVTFSGTSADVSGGAPSTPNTGFRLRLTNPIVVVIYGLVAVTIITLIGRKLLRR